MLLGGEGRIIDGQWDERRFERKCVCRWLRLGVDNGDVGLTNETSDRIALVSMHEWEKMQVQTESAGQGNTYDGASVWPPARDSVGLTTRSSIEYLKEKSSRAVLACQGSQRPLHFFIHPLAIAIVDPIRYANSIPREHSPSRNVGHNGHVVILSEPHTPAVTM